MAQKEETREPKIMEKQTSVFRRETKLKHKKK